VLGGPARTRAVLLLAGVLALNAADTGAIGAVAAPLEADLRINQTQLGLLATVSSGLGALAAPMAGVLADRTNRVRLLAISILTWSAALVGGGLATSYVWLLLSRLALGAAVAAAGPMVASLIGDLFPPADRARTYGWVLTGEILGAGLGLLAGAAIAGALTWRAPFFLLAAVGLGLAAILWRLLPEPGRGGASWLHRGARTVRPADSHAPPANQQEPSDANQPGSDAQATIAGKGVKPVSERILRTDPAQLSWWAAARYILSIPTLRYLIVASAAGYFFFAGLRVFVVVFAVHRFDVSQGIISVLVLVIGAGALTGTLLGGRIADRAMQRGHPTIRVVLPSIGYAVAAVLFAPGLLLTVVWGALALFTVAAGFLAGANPPLDAARLDIMPGRLWGRAESVRTVLRLFAEAVAPLVFGFTADSLGGSDHRAAGLRDAFLIMLVPLLVNAAITLYSRRTYPADVATAAASDGRPSAEPSGTQQQDHRQG
jgi:predicted MFS family arabinose efflux permease